MNIHVLDNNQSEITWNNSWVTPFESPWGILEKIKYINLVTSNDLLHYWGNKKVKSLKSGIGRIHRNLFTLQGLDDSLIQKSLGFSLRDHNRSGIDHLLRPFFDSSINPEKYLRDELFFCRECGVQGHHSLFFQFKLIHHCPYHQVPLFRGCVKCNISIPYLFSDEFTEEPFVCKCGHMLLSVNRSTSSWNKIDKDIESLSIKRWLDLDSTEIDYFNRFRFFSGMDLEKSNRILDNLLLTIDQDHKLPGYFKTVTTSYINNLNINHRDTDNNQSSLKNRIHKLYTIEDSITMLSNNPKFSEQYEYIYKSSRKIVSSIARQIRKSIYPEHKTCVKRLVNLLKEPNEPFPEFCPYAYAYVFWKQSVDGIEHYYKVDNYGYPTRGSETSIECASVIDRPFINSFISEWIRYFEFTGRYKMVALTWNLNRLIATLVLHHYNNWLSIAQEYAHKREKADYALYQYRNLPFFTFVFPENENGKFEFHYWEENSLFSKDLECPFPTKGSKKIKPTEINHTPPKLYINN